MLAVALDYIQQRFEYQRFGLHHNDGINGSFEIVGLDGDNIWQEVCRIKRRATQDDLNDYGEGLLFQSDKLKSEIGKVAPVERHWWPLRNTRHDPRIRVRFPEPEGVNMRCRWMPEKGTRPLVADVKAIGEDIWLTDVGENDGSLIIHLVKDKHEAIVTVAYPTSASPEIWCVDALGELLTVGFMEHIDKVWSVVPGRVLAHELNSPLNLYAVNLSYLAPWNRQWRTMWGDTPLVPLRMEGFVGLRGHALNDAALRQRYVDSKYTFSHGQKRRMEDTGLSVPTSGKVKLWT